MQKYVKITKSFKFLKTTTNRQKQALLCLVFLSRNGKSRINNKFLRWRFQKMLGLKYGSYFKMIRILKEKGLLAEDRYKNTYISPKVLNFRNFIMVPVFKETFQKGFDIESFLNDLNEKDSHPAQKLWAFPVSKRTFLNRKKSKLQYNKMNLIINTTKNYNNFLNLICTERGFSKKQVVWHETKQIRIKNQVFLVHKGKRFVKKSDLDYSYIEFLGKTYGGFMSENKEITRLSAQEMGKIRDRRVLRTLGTMYHNTICPFKKQELFQKGCFLRKELDPSYKMPQFKKVVASIQTKRKHGDFLKEFLRQKKLNQSKKF